MLSPLNWNDRKLELDMGMSQRDFAKARLLPFLEDEGLVVRLEEGAYSETSWKFSEVVQQGDTIKIAGEGLEGDTLGGKTLFELLPLGENPGRLGVATRAALLKTVFRAMEVVLERRPDFRFAGPLQTILFPATDPEKILFLPPTLLQKAIESRSPKEQALMLGCFQDPLLQAKKEAAGALAFSQSVYLYLSLSGQLPFPQEKKEQRTMDYRDGNFLPLELLVAGISGKLAAAVNNNLQLGAVDSDGSKFNVREKIKGKGGTAAAGPVLLGGVLSGLSCEGLLQEASPEEVNELERQRQNYQIQLEKRLNHRRFIRKNSAFIKTGAVALAIVLTALGMGLKDRQNEFVATGLNPTQVCQVLYTALSGQNLVMARAMCRGKATEEFQDKLSNFFVSNRMRAGMDPTSLSMTPNQWLLYLEQQQAAASRAAFQPRRDVWIYGLTNFNLLIENEKTTHLPFYPPQRRDNARPVKDLSKMPVRALATYSIVYNDSRASFQIQNYEDLLILEYIRDSWQVVSIEQKLSSETIEIAQVEETFGQLLEDSGGNLGVATDKMVQLYPWIR